MLGLVGADDVDDVDVDDEEVDVEVTGVMNVVPGGGGIELGGVAVVGGTPAEGCAYTCCWGMIGGG